MAANPVVEAASLTLKDLQKIYTSEVEEADQTPMKSKLETLS